MDAAVSAEQVCGDEGIARSERRACRLAELVDDDARAGILGAGPLDQRSRGRGLAAGLTPIVNQRDRITSTAGGVLQTQHMGGAPVIARGLLGELGAVEQSGLLADCHESDTQPSRCRGTEKEVARLDASDLGDGARKGLGERVDDSIEEIRVVEHRPDIRVSVREGDAITDLGDQFRVRHSRHGSPQQAESGASS